MASTGRPWAVVITAVVAALVAAGALAAASALRDRGERTAMPPSTGTSTSKPGPGVDGCYVQPCTVLGQIPVGGETVQLMADAGGHSARVRIGGAGSSEVIEVSITGMGAVLGRESLQCEVANSITACLVRGQYDLGVVGQVIVGRSGRWSELSRPFESDAGYIGLANILADQGAEVLVAQHRCDQQEQANCATTPVYVRVYNLRNHEQGCTRNYARLDALPKWPNVTFPSGALEICS